MTDVDRRALAGDLGRGGYLRGAYEFAGGASARWFQTDLVLTRPGVLSRCAELLAPELPPDADRLAARGPTAVALATALALATGAQLVLGADRPDGPRFDGDVFPGARVVLVEDVLLTGTHARESLAALAAGGLDVRQVVCMLDRLQGARFALEEDGLAVVALFGEDDLLS
jgi:orotate phosphoribosyltransferase